jgi:hypothetical protein
MATTTRSSYKCCISNITLSTSDSFLVDTRVIHKRLFTMWATQYPGTLPDGSVYHTVTDHDGTEVRSAAAAEAAAEAAEAAAAEPQTPISVQEKTRFAEDEFTTVLAQIVCLPSAWPSITAAAATTTSSTQTAVVFTYFKVISAWLLVLDSRCALENLTKAADTLNQMDLSVDIEPFILLINSTLSAILNLPNASAMVADIDEQKFQFATIDIIRYAVVASNEFMPVFFVNN